MAPDNSAALVYLKSDGGQNHPFVSRFVNGAWGAPQRVDPDSSNAASVPAHRFGQRRQGRRQLHHAAATPSPASARLPGRRSAPSTSSRPAAAWRMSTCPRTAMATSSPRASNDIFAERLEGDDLDRRRIGCPRLRSDARGRRRQPRRPNRGVRRRGRRRGGVGRGDVANTDEDVFVRRLTAPLPATRLAHGSRPVRYPVRARPLGRWPTSRPWTWMAPGRSGSSTGRTSSTAGQSATARSPARSPVRRSAQDSSWTRWGTPRPRAATSSRSP